MSTTVNKYATVYRSASEPVFDLSQIFYLGFGFQMTSRYFRISDRPTILDYILYETYYIVKEKLLNNL